MKINRFKLNKLIFLSLFILLLTNCQKEDKFLLDKVNKQDENSVKQELSKELDDFENNKNSCLKTLGGYNGINAVDRSFSHDYQFLHSFSFNFSSGYIIKGETAFILLYNNSAVKTKRLIITESRNGSTIRQKTISLSPKNGYYFYCFLSENVSEHVNTLYNIHTDLQDSEDFTARVFTEALSNFWYSPYNAFPQVVKSDIPTYLQKELNQYGEFTSYDENHISEYYVYTWFYEGSEKRLGSFRAKYLGQNSCKSTKYNDKYVIIHRMKVNGKRMAETRVYFDNGSRVGAFSLSLLDIKPLNLKLINKTQTSIKFSWDGVAGAKYYYIWRRIPGQRIKRIKTLSSNYTNYTNSGLLRNTNYEYFVQASFGSNRTPFSKSLACKTLP